MSYDQIAETQNRCTQMIDALEFVRDNPAIFPDGIYIWSDELGSTYYGDNAKNDIADAARIIRRHFGITETAKNYETNMFRMRLDIPDSHVYFALSVARDRVCTRIDTGRTETKEVLDYANAPKITKEVPVIEWECDPLLAD